MFKLGKRFQTKDHNGKQNDKYWDDGDNSCMLRTFWIFKQQPHFSLKVVRWKGFFLLFNKALILPEIILETLTHYCWQFVTVYPYLVMFSNVTSLFIMNILSKKYVPELGYGIVSKFIELNFLRKDIEWNIDRPSQPPSTLIIVDDGFKAVPMPVKIVLIADGVEVPNTPGRISQ